MSPYLAALMSNFSWGLGTQFFAHYSKKLSPVWTNTFKGVLGCILFGLTVIFTGGFHYIAPGALGLFLISGVLGLGLADIFILKAFAAIGSSRTIMILSFETVAVGILSYFIFGQKIDFTKLSAIIFLIACIFIFALENYKKTSKWQWGIIFTALTGVFFDALGIIATRAAFNISGARAVEANAYRSLGAVIFFIIISRVTDLRFFTKLHQLPAKSVMWITFGSFMGMYVALLFHLYALKTGHLATISAMACTGVVFAAMFECIFERKWPSKYLLAAFVLFLCAMFILFA